LQEAAAGREEEGIYKTEEEGKIKEEAIIE